MKRFTKIGVMLAGALIVLGCQKSNDPSDTPPPGSASEAPDEVTAEPQATTGSPDDNDPVADAPAGSTDLVEPVKELMSMQTVEQTDTGIKITFVLDRAASLSDESTPQDVSDAMMFATFYTAPHLYGHLADMDGLEQSFVYRGVTIGGIKMTRASYASLNYSAAMQGVTEKEAKRPVYRKLLNQLPKGAVRIDRKYRP